MVAWTILSDSLSRADPAVGLASREIAVLRYDKRTRVHADLMRDLPGLTVKEETIDDAIAATGMSVPAEYNTPGHISEAVVRDIPTWITALPPRRE